MRGETEVLLGSHSMEKLCGSSIPVPNIGWIVRETNLVSWVKATDPLQGHSELKPGYNALRSRSHTAWQVEGQQPTPVRLYLYRDELQNKLNVRRQLPCGTPYVRWR